MSSDGNAKDKPGSDKKKGKKKGRVGSLWSDYVAHRLLVAGGMPRISEKQGHVRVVNRYIHRMVGTVTARARRHAAAENCGTLAYIHVRKALEELGCRRLHLCMTRRESEMVEKAAQRRAKTAERTAAKREAAAAQEKPVVADA